MPSRRAIALILLVPVVIVAAFGLYLLDLAGELPWQAAPTPISAGITPFANLTSENLAAATPRPGDPLATPAAGGESLFRVVPDQSVARYVVREKLAGVAVDSDAVGETHAVEGQIGLDAAGKPLPGSTWKVDLRLLKSDKVRRDNDVKKLFLETDKYPIATFVVAEVSGLSGPLVDGATVQGEVRGDLTAHGVTKAVAWQATVTRQGDTLTGKATTSFPFADFDMPVPNIYGMVSARDPVNLELEFTAKRAG